MNVLLDTHAFIWLDVDSTKLSATARGYLVDPGNRLLLSVAPVWELAIKIGSGKLSLTGDLATVVAEQTNRNPFELLPVSAPHAYVVQSLPTIHRDPFDRMLVAQAIVENAVLLSKDPHVRRYPVRTDW